MRIKKDGGLRPCAPIAKDGGLRAQAAREQGALGGLPVTEGTDSRRKIHLNYRGQNPLFTPHQIRQPRQK